MGNDFKNLAVEEAINDLRNHTLRGLPGEVARLVYLASTRDYNTGQYYHDGLAFHFTEEVAGAALAKYHNETFQKLVFGSMEDMVRHLEVYVTSSSVPTGEFLEFWRKVEPYRVTIPLDCDDVSVVLFFSNIRVALAILRYRQKRKPDS